MFYTGIIENRSDPLQLGRCQVRIVGLHTHDKNQLPTNDLPWAVPVQPVNSAAMNGIGLTPVGPVEGTTVIIMFADETQQQPIMLGTIGGIPYTPSAISDDDSGTEITVATKTKDIQLRTIPGPTTGKQLTFFDPESSRTDLTKDLKANMKVIGFGLPSNTFIVTIDSGTQITISEHVTGYGENIIKFGNPPINLDAVNKSKVSNVLVDGSGNPVTTSDGTPIRTGNPTPSATVANTPKPSNTNSSIPTIPPPKSTTNESKASEGIKALIAACDKVGLTTKEQKCALLGIAGGESRWIPQLEQYSYTPTRLKQIYKFATDEDVNRYSNAPKKGISREEFFSWAYGPTKRGKNFLGNKTDADGGKYFGRGFIQLTGRGNYERYQRLANATGLNIDIVNNPDSLDADINVSALVAALYIKDRVSTAVNVSAHPGYFLAAKKAVGVNSPDISAIKTKYYEYFYGELSSSSVDKDAAAPIAVPPPADKTVTPGPSEESIKRGTDNTGFRDPNNKYPLPDYIGEPDTNRLARGIIEGTVVGIKDASRVRGVPKAINNGFWDQPPAPFGAKYPFNKVFESESGHIQEFDDTPGQERINTYHRSGTYTEIDSQGTQVNYIVGDNFILMERNGCVHVAGECNITVDGNTNIFARSDANIEVSGSASLKVGNNLDIGVANDIYMAAGGDVLIKANGDFAVQASNISEKAEAVNIQSSADMNILAGGILQADYSQGQFGNGADEANDVDLTPPDAGDPLNPTVPFLVPVERAFENKAAAETPEDYNTPEGRAVSNAETQTEGVPNAPAPVAQETAPVTTGGATTKKSTDCSIIYSTTNFTNDFRISKNFTLGMLMDGGLGGRHRLVDQLLKEVDSGPERLYTVNEIVCNLANSCENLLEPIIDLLPDGIAGYKRLWTISSGYRLKGVIPYESPTSQHCKGQAFDIILYSADKYNKTYELVQKVEKIISYDQLILEYRYPGSCWMHMSYRIDGNRKQSFTMVNDRVYDIENRKFPAGFVLVGEIPPKNKKA